MRELNLSAVPMMSQLQLDQILQDVAVMQKNMDVVQINQLQLMELISLDARATLMSMDAVQMENELQGDLDR